MSCLFSRCRLLLTQPRFVTASQRCLPTTAVATDAQKRQPKPFSDVPGPRALPLIGTAWVVLPVVGQPVDLSKLHEVFMEQAKTYGRIYKQIIPGVGPLVFLSSADLIEELFRAIGNRHEREILMPIRAYREKRKELFGDNMGVLIDNGERWYKIRSNIQQNMMRPKSALFYLDPMQDVASEFLERMRELRDEKQELPANFQQELYKWALESVSCMALNRRLGCFRKDVSPDSDALRMIRAVLTLFEGLTVTENHPPIWKIFPTKSFRQIVHAMDTFTEISKRAIQSAIEDLERHLEEKTDAEPSVLEMILQRLTPKEVLVTIQDFLLAGIDTTSHTMGFTMFTVATHPHVQERLREEVDRVVGPDPSTRITGAMLNELSYMKAVIRETLRLYPVVLGTVRIAPEDLVIGGYSIPKGAWLIPMDYMTTRDPQNFLEPLVFKPERWLRENRKGKVINPFASQPFGYGARMCIGRRFAEQEMWLLLTKLIQNFRMEYHHDPIDIETRFLNIPNQPLRFRLLDRDPKSTS